MTLPASGTISFNDINVELGRPAGNFLWLGEPDCRTLAGVPSGPISLHDFYGKSWINVSNPLPDVSSFDIGVIGGGSFASAEFTPTGYINMAGATFSGGQWLTPAGIAPSVTYWLKVVRNSGAVPSGIAMGTWYSLTSSRGVSLSRSSVGTSGCDLTYYISTTNSDAGIIRSATIALSVTVEI